jgi:hypothetical protein
MWCITGHFFTIIVYTYCRDRAGFGFENVFKYQNEWHLHYVNIWELLSQLNWDNMKCGVRDNWVTIECWKLGIKVAKIEHYFRLQFVLIVNNNNIYNMVSINMFYICFIYVLYNFTVTFVRE